MSKKQLLIITLIVILVLIIGNAILERLTSRPQPTTGEETNQTPTSDTFHSLVPGNQSPAELPESSGFVAETEENGVIKTEFKSAHPLINNEVVIKDGEVKMKKTLAKDAAGNQPTIEQYFRTNGEAELTTFDANWGTQVFAWPSKGLAVAGSRELDELFRSYTFEPMSIDEFKTEFSSEFNFDTPSNELGY